MNSPPASRAIRGASAIPLRAQIVEHVGDAGAEKLLPQPVHENPRRERILSGDEPIRQIQPGRAAIGRRGGRQEIRDTREAC